MSSRGRQSTLPLLVALAGLAVPATSQASLAPWVDSDGPSFSPGTQILSGGPSLVAKGFSSRTLRFFAPPSSAFRQWSPPTNEYGDPYSVGNYTVAPSGAAWVELDIDDDTTSGFERVGADGTVLTPATDPCGENEDGGMSLVAAGSDERAWIQCDSSLATIAVDGTRTSVRCAVCGGSEVLMEPAANGRLWVANTHQDSGWDLRLVDPVSGVVGARSFQGPAPGELVDAGSRVYWLRPSAGRGATRILESLDAATWLTSGTAVARQGLSEAIGRSKNPVDPFLQSMVSTGDGSVWLAAMTFRRVVHVDAAQNVTELPASGWPAGSSAGAVFAASGRIWVWMDSGHVNRVSAAPQPTLPILYQHLTFRVGNYTDPIGLLTSLRIRSSHVVAGTRVTVKCLSKCSGHAASATAHGSAVDLTSSLTLDKGAKVVVTSSHPGYRSTTTVYQLRRNKKRTRIVIRIVKIDSTPYKNLIVCGC